MVLGHGSPPKTSGATETEHDCFPMQFCTRISSTIREKKIMPNNNSNDNNKRTQETKQET